MKEEEDAKEIDKKCIQVQKGDKIIGDKKDNNFWYKKFKYCGKTFIQISKKNFAKNSEYVVYYCHYHSTTIESNKLTKTRFWIFYEIVK